MIGRVVKFTDMFITTKPENKMAAMTVSLT